MKWFRHSTSTSSHMHLEELQSSLGLEAYGRFWILAEKIGEKMDRDSSDPKTTFKWDQWRRFLKYDKPDDLKKYLEQLQNIGLVEIVDNEASQYLTIKLPILTELSDPRAVSSSKREKASKQNEPIQAHSVSSHTSAKVPNPPKSTPEQGKYVDMTRPLTSNESEF